MTETTAPTRFAPGIYFDMPEDIYHADPALGSSDVRKMRRSGPDYWWSSWMNPNRPPDSGDTPAKLRGRAIHKVVLEGQPAFDRLYSRRRDDVADATSGDKSAVTKAEKLRAASEGKDLLHGDDWDRAVITGAMIRKNPHLATAFDDSGRSEVSVFWEREILVPVLAADGNIPIDGKPAMIKVPCKARFDKLRPRAIGDLKSITNMRGRDFVVACRNAISDYRYDIQAAHYLEGRAQVSALVKAGAMFERDGKPALPDRHEFCANVAKAKTFAFVIVFFQAEDAPITWGAILSPANPMIEVANRHREEALQRYADFMQRFGPNEMWLLAEPLAELDISEMPAWYGR